MTANSADQSMPSGEPEHRTAASGARLTSADLAAAIAATQPHQCPNCGTSVDPNETICPGCGIRLRKVARQIRCRHCNHRSSSELVICPSCGRELRAAPSRLLTWGAPLILVALLILTLVTRTNLSVGTLANALDGEAGEAISAEVSDAPALTLNSGPETESAGPTVPVQEPTQTAVPPTATAESPAIVAVRNTSTPTPEPDPATATPTPTATATATPSLVPTSTFTRTPTPTATLDELSYTVQAGDTLLRIARMHGVTVDGILAVNDMLPEDATRIRPGLVLIIPAGGTRPATGTANAAATPIPAVPTSTPTPATIYILQSGDSPAKVAQRFGISVSALLAANGLTEADATRLQVGIELIIPGAGQIIPTPTPAATNTPAATPSIRLAAPVLRSPEPGTPMRCAADVQDSLAWNVVPGMGPGDEYELHLGYISGPPQADGTESINWTFSNRRPQTSWKLEHDLCRLAPQEFNRQWRWYVQVVNGDAVVSPPSPIWAFSWN